MRRCGWNSVRKNGYGLVADLEVRRWTGMQSRNDGLREKLLRFNVCKAASGSSLTSYCRKCPDCRRKKRQTPSVLHGEKEKGREVWKEEDYTRRSWCSRTWAMVKTSVSAQRYRAESAERTIGVSRVVHIRGITAET